MICRMAVELVSRSQDSSLSASEWLGLNVHTLFCGPCRRFRRQADHLETAYAAAPDQNPPGEDVLDGVARQRILTALLQEWDDPS